MLTWPTKRVAPTAVTHGDEAGHEGQSTAGRVGQSVTDVLPGAGTVPLMALYMVHVPAIAFVAELVPLADPAMRHPELTSGYISPYKPPWLMQLKRWGERGSHQCGR